MIIPTAEYDPMYADDGIPFKIKMMAWIKIKFKKELGTRANLIFHPSGLNVIQEETRLKLEKLRKQQSVLERIA